MASSVCFQLLEVIPEVDEHDVAFVPEKREQGGAIAVPLE